MTEIHLLRTVRAMPRTSSIGPGRQDPQREPDRIVVEGAREHNLQVDRLELPKHRLVVITGPSGGPVSGAIVPTTGSVGCAVITKLLAL